MKYRRDIDGLRSIAVVPVILFHGGFPGFDGGFVGVDIFFVLSGFLITGILAEDFEKNRFSLIEFYERRARRILPALFAVMLICIPFAYLWFAPRDLLNFGQSLIGTAIFASNILFWIESGYFERAAELKPLLHTWSLSVEEQFYLFFPLLLLIIWRFGQRVTLTVLGLVLLCSLLFSEWLLPRDPSGAYFLLPTRAWELMIGSILALLVRKKTVMFPRPVEEGMGLFGLALIGFAVFVFDHNTPFPGLWALVPTVGTALLLVPSQGPTLTVRVLSMPALVGVGLISYSAYLWHQPLFAFARYTSLEEPSKLVMIGLVGATFGLAYLSWRFVERPFRRRDVTSTSFVWASLGTTAASLLAVGVVFWQSTGVPSRLNMPQSVEASMVRSERTAECFNISQMHIAADWTCPLGEEDGDTQFLVFGDSHALSLLDVFDAVATETGIKGEFTATNGCTPFLGIHALRSDQHKANCNQANSRLIAYAKEKNVRDVVLVSKWSYYTDGGHGRDNLSYLSLNPDGPKTMEESRAAFEAGLDLTLRTYRDAGITLYMVAQVPQQRIDPRLAYARAYVSRQKPDPTLATLSVSAQEHEDLQGFVHGLFKSYAAPVWDFTDTLCDGDVCIMGTAETSFYFDDDHLSLEGAARLTPAMIELFNAMATND